MVLRIDIVKISNRGKRQLSEKVRRRSPLAARTARRRCRQEGRPAKGRPRRVLRSELRFEPSSHAPNWARDAMGEAELTARDVSSASRALYRDANAFMSACMRALYSSDQ